MSFSGLQMRPITAEEYPAYHANISLTFGEDDRAEERERGRDILELDRTLAVFDADRVVAGAAIWPCRPPSSVPPTSAEPLW